MIWTRAREHARESIAVLRLFQQERWRYVDTDFQTFGLEVNIAWLRSLYWEFNGREVRTLGAIADGIAAEWTMKREDRQAFMADPLYAFLDAALRVEPGERDRVQRRPLATRDPYDAAANGRTVRRQTVACL